MFGQSVMPQEFLAKTDFSKISKDKLLFVETLSVMDYAKLKEMLLTGIEISLNNIAGKNFTRLNSDLPYLYEYLVIYKDFSFLVLEREKFRMMYDPIHPDAILEGEFKGYVRYPDINIEQESNDIAEMVLILRKMEKQQDKK
jgi:hypothetical protein